MRERIYFILFSFLGLILSISGKINNVVPVADSGNHTGTFINVASHSTPGKICRLVKGNGKRFRHIVRSKALDDTQAVDLAYACLLHCGISYNTRRVYCSYGQSACSTHASEHSLRGPPPYRRVS